MEHIRRFFYNLMTDKHRGFFSYPIKFILWILSLIYGFMLWIRDASYRVGLARSQSFPEAKIISVGNVTMGGTGKTPMVIKLATLLKEKGRRVAVLLRGYGEDEYAMLKNSLGNTPVLRGKNRIKNGKQAIKRHGVDTLILDDAFQYKRLKKDFNIVLVDSKNPFGNKYLLPRGILRERISNLKDAHVIVLTKTEGEASALAPIKEQLKNISGDLEIFQTFHKPLSLYEIGNNKEYPLSFLGSKEIAALSAIGDPEYFKALLEKLGAKIVLKFSFLDHHKYNQKEINSIISCCKNYGLDTVLVTDKDAVKLSKFLIDGTVKLFSLRIKIDFTKDEDYFVNRLLRVFTR